jgi:hypothetical protein
MMKKIKEIMKYHKKKKIIMIHQNQVCFSKPPVNNYQMVNSLN